MDGKRQKTQWTARFVMRIIGAAMLAAMVIMALLGVFVIDVTGSATRFFVYWSIFFVLMLGAIVIAILDALATIGKFRIEHAKLRSAFHRELKNQEAPEQQNRNQMHEKRQPE